MKINLNLKSLDHIVINLLERVMLCGDETYTINAVKRSLESLLVQKSSNIKLFLSQKSSARVTFSSEIAH